MTDYNKSVNFAVKDTLTSGDPNKIVSGSEIDTEFNNIASSSGTKADKVFAATDNNFAGLNASGNLIDSGKSPSDFADSTDTENRLSTLETDIDDKANKVLSATEDNFASLDSDGDLKDSGQNSDTLINISSPTGAVIAFAATNPPNGWLECDGSAISRSTFSNLFSIIGTTFGIGDGVSTFNLPDLRGEFVRGWDNGDGADFPRELGSFQDEQIKKHKHVMSWGEKNTSQAEFGTTDSKNFYGSSATDRDNFLFYTNDGSDFDGTVNPSGLIGNETRPRNVALMYIIKI